MQIQNALITGSFSYNGADLSNITSSNAYSASLSIRTTNLESTASSLVGASSSFSSILTSVSSSQQQISSSLLNVIAIGATTGSNSFRANQSITGSLVVSSTITAQTLVVQTVTSSILYSSGSNLFGNALSNTQTFTGSLNVTGSSHAIFGSIGINTTAPTVALQVYSTGSSSSNVTAEFWNGDYGTGTRNFIRLRNAATIASTTSAYFGQGQDQKTYFYNNDFSRLGDIVITNTGKVGIGTASPIAQLHVKTDVASANRPTTLATSATNSAAYITTICGSSAGIAFGQLGANSNYIQSTYENGSACTPLILNPYSGNVGIGTGNTAPGGALDVVTCSNSTQNFYLRNTSNLDASSRAYFNVVAGNTSLSLLALAGGGSCGGTYIAGTTGADMYFQQSQGGTVNMIIKSNGSLGVGTLSPKTRLQVTPSYNAEVPILGCASGVAVFTSANGNYGLQLNSTSDGSFHIQSQRFDASATAYSLVLQPSGASVGIATTNPRTQLDVGDIVNGVGGTTFCAFLVAQGTWATFACVTNGDTNVITDITYVNNNDYNRSGAILARWAYHSPTAALYITDCAYNWQQNINQFGLRNNGGALQICLGGGANGYRVQARVQGARATG